MTDKSTVQPGEEATGRLSRPTPTGAAVMGEGGNMVHCAQGVIERRADAYAAEHLWP